MQYIEDTSLAVDWQYERESLQRERAEKWADDNHKHLAELCATNPVWVQIAISDSEVSEKMTASIAARLALNCAMETVRTALVKYAEDCAYKYLYEEALYNNRFHGPDNVEVVEWQEYAPNPSNKDSGYWMKVV